MRCFLLGFLACLALFSVRPAAAQTWEDYDYENLEFRGVGLELGVVRPARVDAALSLGLRADLGYLGPNVRIFPGISYWSSTMRQQEVNRLSEQLQGVCLRQRERLAECPPLDLGQIRLSDLAFHLDGHYEWTETPLLLVPYAGLGVGVHLLNGRGEAINGTFIEDFLDGITPGLNLIGGLRVPITNSFDVIGEARYTLASEVRHGSINIGGMLLFPTRAPIQPRR